MKSSEEIADDEIADRFSTLPEDILLEILSHFSLKESAASSVLSKTWTTLWIELPNLDLDDRNLEGYEFRHLIRKVVVTRETHPVHRLRLSWIQEEIPTWDVVGWVSCLVGKETKQIDVCVETTFQRRYHLPNCLFFDGNENLVENIVSLKLKGFMVLDTTYYLFAFPSLKVLELINILYTEGDSLSKILSSFTVIEDLKLQIGVQTLKSLRVTFSTGTLKRFQCRLLSRGPTCEFKIDTPALEFCNFRADRAQDCQIQFEENKGFDIIEEETHLFEGDWKDEDY